MKQTSVPSVLANIASQIEIGRPTADKPPGFERVITGNLFAGRGLALQDGRTLQVFVSIAVHSSTSKFPFLGGTRILVNSEPAAATAEARGLAHAMTRKNIWLALILSNFPKLLQATSVTPSTSVEDILGLLSSVTLDRVPLQYKRGGVKATLNFSVDPRTLTPLDRMIVFAAYGKFAAASLPTGAGQLSVDAGCSTDDMVSALFGIGDRRDRIFAGLHPVMGGHGDPSPITSEATLAGIRKVAAEYLPVSRHGDLHRLRVAVEGSMGKVGSALCTGLLDGSSASCVLMTDINEDGMFSRYGGHDRRVQFVSAQDDALYLRDDWDILVPASGRFQQFTPELAARIIETRDGKPGVILGPQNCMFEPEQSLRTAEIFHRGGIITIDDAALSGGGVACVAGEGYNRVVPLSAAEQRENKPKLVDAIAEGVSLLINTAQTINVPPTELFYAITDRAVDVLDVGEPIFAPSSANGAPTTA